VATTLLYSTHLTHCPSIGLYSWVVNRRYYIQARKAEIKLRDLYEVPGGIEKLKRFVGIVSRLLPPLYGSVIVKI
jgi:hypothetical protein